MYRLRRGSRGSQARSSRRPLVQLLGSGAILLETLRARQILSKRYRVAADVWSVTSYKELRREALAADRWNRLHPGEPPRVPHVARSLDPDRGPVIAASDYMQLVPEMIARWTPGGLTSLGTDGFGRSETRARLRRFFEVDAESIVLASLTELARRGEIKQTVLAKAIDDLGIDPSKADPVEA